jgi:hypothetical protein
VSYIGKSKARASFEGLKTKEYIKAKKREKYFPYYEILFQRT